MSAAVSGKVAPSAKFPETPHPAMDEATITTYLTTTFPGVVVTSAEGATSFAYDPDRVPSAAVYFATLKSRDEPNDDVSQLDRPAVFRLNIALPVEDFQRLFGPPPPPPGDDGLVETRHDFSALDRLLPHPVYAYLAWACVVSPSAATLETMKPLLARAYALAQARYRPSA